MGRTSTLVVRAGGRVCALELAHVIETMRPLPLAPLRGAPAHIPGLSVIRGEPTAVVDLGALLGDRTERRGGRVVLLRLGVHRAALEVDEVIGVRELDGAARSPLPITLEQAAGGAVVAAAAVDDELLLVLQIARLVPDEVWALVERAT